MDSQKEIIIVTGCSGRIGMKALRRFSQKYQVIGFDIYSSPQIPPEVEFMYVDLASTESVQRAFKRIKLVYGDRIASVIHLAAYYSFTGDRPELYDAITVKGTERLLQACKDFQVQQFIFSSTMLVHGTCKPNERINEDSPVVGKWDYPRSKVQTEEVMRKMHGDMPIVQLRIAGCYDDECHSIPISNHIQRVYEKQAIAKLFPGNVTHGAAFLHLDDLDDLVDICVERRTQLPSELTLLVAEEETLSYDTLQRTISRLIHGEEMSTIIIPKWFAKMGAWMQDRTPFVPKSFVKPWMIELADDNYTVDMSRARNVLGWQPKRLLSQTLPKMIEQIKADPLKFYRINGLVVPGWLKRKAFEGGQHGK